MLPNCVSRGGIPLCIKSLPSVEPPAAWGVDPGVAPAAGAVGVVPTVGVGPGVGDVPTVGVTDGVVTAVGVGVGVLLGVGVTGACVPFPGAGLVPVLIGVTVDVTPGGVVATGAFCVPLLTGPGTCLLFCDPVR